MCWKGIWLIQDENCPRRMLNWLSLHGEVESAKRIAPSFSLRCSISCGSNRREDHDDRENILGIVRCTCDLGRCASLGLPRPGCTTACTGVRRRNCHHQKPSSPIREVQEFAAATDRFRASNENISARASAAQTLAGAAVLVETARERAISNASTEIRSRWAIQDEAALRQRRRQRWIDWQEESLDLRERLGRIRQREDELVQVGILQARPEKRTAINGVEWHHK